MRDEAVTIPEMEAEEHRGSDEITEMFCELCRKKGKTVSADGFCVDCVRYFCTECLAYHTEFIPDHIVQDKKRMPQDVCLQQCPGHDEEIIKFFCSSCIKFFCQLCKKNDHANCENVKHLPQFVDQFEQGNEFKEFKGQLEGLVNEVRNFELVIERDKESIEVISAKALLKIESTRQHLIECLNKRFLEIQAEVQTLKQKDKTELENNSLKLSAIKEQMDSISSNVEQLQKEEKRCKLFMTMKDAQSKQQEFSDFLSMLKSRNITKYEIEQSLDYDRFLRNVMQLRKLDCRRTEDLRGEQTEKWRSRTSVNAEGKFDSDLSFSMETEQVAQVLSLKQRGNLKKKKKNKSKKTPGNEEEKEYSATDRGLKTKTDQFPDREVQKTYIAEQLQRPLIQGDLWFVLDKKWFSLWKRYVGFESREKRSVWVVSAHPGQIDNTPILHERTTKLKENLVDNLDYVLVPEEGWNKLVCWYGMAGGQDPLARKVIVGGILSKSLKVEVYPWTLTLCENSNQVSKIFSRSDTVGQLVEVMRETFGIETEKEVRIWKRCPRDMYELLINKERTIQGAGLYNGQVILIEQKNCDGTWPRNMP